VGYEVDDEAAPVRYVKVHDAYTHAQGEPLLAGARGATGAVVIVRDPRDIASSLAHHNVESLDDTIAFMHDDTAAFSGATDRQPFQLRQRLGSWSTHVDGWLAQTDIPVHVVRYEDMQTDPASALRGVLRFCGHDAGEPDIARAAARSAFADIKRQEQATGFREAPHPETRDFFRRGEAGAWRDELTAAQAARIEADHAAMMQRLGYAL
jgi:hypothetical protein